LVVGIAFLSIAAFSILPPVNSSNNNEDNDGEIVAKGEVTNSKYLSVSAVSYNRNEEMINISGIITNFDNKESLAQVSAVAVLYDSENGLITAVTGLANSATLEPQQQTPFTITASLPSGEDVARYVILPAGSVVND
jgi:tRNA-binding EMAP/Myf-like protein